MFDFGKKNFGNARQKKGAIIQGEIIPTQLHVARSCLVFSNWSLFYILRTYRLGFIGPLETEAREGPLCEWRIHLTQNMKFKRHYNPNDWGMDTAVGKALHLGNAFRTHIETLTILLNNVPEMQKLQVATRQVKRTVDSCRTKNIK